MELTLKRNDGGTEYSVAIAPENGKIQSYLRYAGLTLVKEHKNRFSLIDSIKKGANETYILSIITLDFLGKTLHDLIRPNTPADREIAKEMVA